jgi:translin
MADTSALEPAVARIAAHFTEKHQARETALAACRRIIRSSANSIRAAHRGDYYAAGVLLAEAAEAHAEVIDALGEHRDIFHAGFVHDAQKEYAEAHTTLALLSGAPLPRPDELDVEDAAYLNGIAETVGELRRAVLDRLRFGDYDHCESLLQAMDDIYSALVTVDFPDAMTGGLRRSTDQARGILERTRGDLTMAIVQRDAMRAAGYVAQEE